MMKVIVLRLCVVALWCKASPLFAKWWWWTVPTAFHGWGAVVWQMFGVLGWIWILGRVAEIFTWEVPEATHKRLKAELMVNDEIVEVR